MLPKVWRCLPTPSIVAFNLWLDYPLQPEPLGPNTLSFPFNPGRFGS